MKSQFSFDYEHIMISLSDVKQIYITHQKRLVRWAFLGALFALLYFGSFPVEYKAEGSFKENVEKGASENTLKELLHGMSPANQPQAAVLMRSFRVLRPLIEKLGLQVQCEKLSWKIPALFGSLKEAWQAEHNHPLKEIDSFSFQNTFYEEENPFSFSLVFSDATNFTLFDLDKKKELGKGSVGVAMEMSHPRLRFTLLKTPQKIREKKAYFFRIDHWSNMAAILEKQLKILPGKSNRSLISLSIRHRDRYLAAQIVNELMREYQSYLKQEFDQIAKEQLNYLENRQEQTSKKIEGLFEEYSEYLKENLEKNGFLALGVSEKNLLTPHLKLEEQLFAIETELFKIDQLGKEGKLQEEWMDSCVSEQFGDLLRNILELKQQRDLLGLSLCEISEESLETRKRELKEIRNQRFGIAKLLQEVDRGGEISSLDLHPGLGLWANGLLEPEEREDLAEYLEQYLHLLSVREKMLHERFFYGKTIPSELEGIDLSSARALFLEYNGKLDNAEARIRYYVQLQKEMEHSDFDLTSLGSTLTDPLCQKIIQEVTGVILKLKDEHHRTSKEEERWGKEISVQKKILSEHLGELQKIERLNAELIQDKMKILQRISVDCINQQLSVLNEQFSNSLQNKRKALAFEKSLLETKMQDLRSSLAKIVPEKWKFEEWLEIKTDMITKMMKGVSEVVEAKSISNHLHHVESKPLDLALIPTHPMPPHLYRKSLLGAIVVAFFGFIWVLLRQGLKGFPLTLEKLQALKLPALGGVSSYCDGCSLEAPKGPDLDILRRMALFAGSGKVIGLIEGQGPDYSYLFCENLARMSVKSILVRCDFHAKFHKEEGPGLLQIYQREISELPIRKERGFDLLTTGGFTPFGMEMIQSGSFSKLLEVLKENYDQVFLLTRSSLSSAESVAILKYCDRAVVTVCEEKTTELTPFIDWGYHENSCRLTFVARS